MNWNINIRSVTRSAMVVAGFFCCHIYCTQAVAGKFNNIQSKYLDKVIQSQLKNQEDRNYVKNNWTEGQRVAEFICRPLAQKKIAHLHSGVDKVILDQGNENKQYLMSPSLLTGNGQYRIDNGWTPFFYECKISEKTGKAVDFRIIAYSG